jgi:hypothetical protein
MPMRRAGLLSGVDLQLTYEWFGSGKASRRETLVSHRFARLVVEHKWKGIELWPVELV